MPINKKSRVNRIITWLHLWLGLTSGIIVVIVCLTGCLFAFQAEITEFVHKKELFIAPPAHGQALPLSELQQKARQALGKNHPVNFITTYADPHRAWEFMSYEPGDLDAVTLPGSIRFYQSAFLDPYSGAVTGKIDYMHNFFIVVKYIHWSLYLNTRYGQPIVGWATLVFVISLITGFIMWVPKRWSRIEKNKAFKIKWKATWKRINYDLHNVLGFYTVIIAVVLAFTGLVYAFQWFSNAVYAVGSLSTAPPAAAGYASDTLAEKITLPPLDEAFAAVVQKFPAARRYGVALPASRDGSLSVTAYNGRETYYDQSTLYFDQYSGKTLGQESFKEENNGEKLLSMNYDIHVGAVGGLAGKIIAFIVTLVCGSLPITGFIIWWGKKKKPGRVRAAAKIVREDGVPAA